MPQTLSCVQCGQSFPFSEREQRFYAERNFKTPRRCKACRVEQRHNEHPEVPPDDVEKARLEIAGILAAMGLHCDVVVQQNGREHQFCAQPDSDTAPRGMLIGRNGRVVNAMQVIVECIGRAYKGKFTYEVAAERRDDSKR